MIPREIIDAAKAPGRRSRPASRPDHILISATHTHTAPTVAGVFQSEPDADVRRSSSPRRSPRASRRRTTNLAPAQDRLGRRHGAERRSSTAAGRCKPDVDRRRPVRRHHRQGEDEPRLPEPGPGRAGRADRPETSPSCPCRRADGRPLALLANYSLHYVGGMPAAVGRLLRRVRRARSSSCSEAERRRSSASCPTAPAATSTTSTSAGPARQDAALRAGRGSWPTAWPTPALEAYKKIEYRDRRDAAPWPRRRSNCGVRQPTAEDVARAEEILAKAKGQALRRSPEIYARETVLMAKYPAKVKLKLQAIRIGELGIVAIPCEMFAEIGLEIKKKSPLQADVHDRAGQRLQRLPADAGAARASAATRRGGTVELPGGGRLHQDHGRREPSAGGSREMTIRGRH